MRPFYERYEDFVGIEIQNVEIVIDRDTGGFYYEVGAEKPDMYGVYMITNEGPVEHIGDFPTRKNARHYADIINLVIDREFEIYDKTFGEGE